MIPLHTKVQYSDYLPYYSLLNKNIVLTKSGMVLSVVTYIGYDFYEDSYKLEQAYRVLSEALRTLPEGFVVWFDYQRLPIFEHTKDFIDNELARKYDELRQEYYINNPHYNTNKFLCLGYQIPSDKTKYIDKLLYTKQKYQEDFNHTLEKFNTVLTTFINRIYPISITEYELLENEMLLYYLNYNVSLKIQPITFSRTQINDLDFILGNIECHTSYPIKINDLYVISSTINLFPTETYANMFSVLNNLPLDYRLCTRFIIIDKEKALSILNSRRRTFFSNRKSLMSAVRQSEGGGGEELENVEEVKKLDDVTDATARLGNDELMFGYSTTTILTYDKDLKTAIEKHTTLTKEIEQLGFTLKQETIGAFLSLQSTFVGEVTAGVRRPILSTNNLSHFTLLSEVYQGEEFNDHYKKISGNGNPLSIATTIGNNTYYFNLNVADVSHCFIGGSTGYGKSTLLAHILIQFLRYRSTQIYVFDVGKSLKTITTKLDGAIYDIATDDTKFTIQPLSINDPIYINEYIQMLCELNNHQCTQQQQKEIAEATSTFMVQEQSQKTITSYKRIIQDKDIKTILDKYENEERYGKIFNNQSHIELSSKINYFEMDKVLNYNEEVIIPILTYIFRMIENTLNGDPTIIILDECWKYLKNKIFMKKIQEWIKTLRKKNCGIIFATQEIDDFLTSEIASTIINNCPTQILLPNPKIDYQKELYQKSLTITDEHINLIREARPKEQYFIISGTKKALITFDLTEEMIHILFKKEQL